VLYGVRFYIDIIDFSKEVVLALCWLYTWLDFSIVFTRKVYA